eukprot:snap_masked-scaffold_47-processed-gene-0.8-mRNA-1 protein AED:1.00 eAED:1.00 QI:0/-1/0/0/-1/1/1/0/102
MSTTRYGITKKLIFPKSEVVNREPEMLFQRVVQWLANEIFVERLANSRVFQTFAHKTHSGITKTAENVHSGVKNLQNLDTKPAQGFFSQFKEELIKQNTRKK